MSGFSNVVLMGNLTNDPELRYTPQGTAVCDITVAVNSGTKDKQKTAFVDATMWGKTAETVSEYFGRGKPILIHGELQQDNWEDKATGQKRSKLKVNGRSFSFLPGGNESGGSGRGNPAPPQDDADDEVPF